MNVSLTPELERLVNERVKSGMYQTASEVVREALRLLKDHDSQRWLRNEIQKGIDSIERGEYEDHDEASLKDWAADIQARGMKRLAARRKNGKH